MLTFAVGDARRQPTRTRRKDVGFFALPGDDAAKNGLTVWTPAGVYIPKTTDGREARRGQEVPGLRRQPGGLRRRGRGGRAQRARTWSKGCALPADVPQAIKDMQPYFDAGATSPALEFLSPVKGPALEQITVEVGSGIRKAADGAALYDQDVKKQAQQLGLPGW